MSLKPIISIIMGSISDLPVMQKCMDIFEQMELPYEVHALSAHRTPLEVEKFARSAHSRGIKVIIAAAGMAAHLPGVIAAMTPIPVIGVPIKASLDGIDALYAIVQMPPGVPVATVGINASLNAGLLAIQMVAISDENLSKKFILYKEELKKKIVSANEELSRIEGLKYKTN